MAVVRKKQDDKYLKELRELVTTGGGNRQCFDCGQKGPTYVNMTIGSFVCTRCSGVLRGLTPPHRVKSISMATFTQEELDFLKGHGNDLCAKTWLGLWDPKRAVHQDHRELMIDKYERKRYYLEPASPLKSLTNAASLKTNSTISSSTQNSNNNNSNNNSNNNNNNSNGSSSSNSSINGNISHTSSSLTNGYGGGGGGSSVSGTSNNHHQHQHHHHHHNHHNGKQPNAIDNSFQNIQLTPPTSQRNNNLANGFHKTSLTAISRPHQHQQQNHHQQNGLNHHHHHHQAHPHAHQDAFMMNNSLNGLNASVGSSSTGALSDTSSCASNGFGPDSDFVADFGSANIFDATSASSVGSPAVSSASSVASSNGYAKIQSIKAAHQFMNGHANSKLHLNGVTSSINGNTENFADFDHAPIYNAAGLPIPNGINNRSKISANNNNNNNKFGTTPTEDRYAALKDLDEQLRESKAVAAAAASIVATTVVDSFGNNNNNNPSNMVTGVNPFKQQQQQQQHQQQQQQHQHQQQQQQQQHQQQQQQQMVNPFQAQNLLGQMVIPNGLATTAAVGTTTNGFTHQTPATQHQHHPQAAVFFNYSNGYTAATPAAAATNMFPSAISGPNGCGFGFGTMQQQIAATGGGGMNVGAFNNPFAATGGVLNSNNPFL